MGKKQYQKAIDSFNVAIEIEPRASWYGGRGNAYVATKQYDKAIADFTTAIRLEPKDYFYGSRAEAYYATGQYDKAIADRTAAVRLDPKVSSNYNDLAWTLATCPVARLRNGKKAVEYAKKACELSKWNAFASLDTLAAACAEAGDFHAAVRWQEKGMALLKTGDKKEREDAQQRLELYKKRQPYHEVWVWDFDAALGNPVIKAASPPAVPVVIDP